MMVVGLLTFCIGIFIEVSKSREETKNGLIIALLGVLIIVLGVFALTGYRTGLSDGYRAGQIDGLRGDWKYERKFRFDPPAIKEEFTEKY